MQMPPPFFPDTSLKISDYEEALSPCPPTSLVALALASLWVPHILTSNAPGWNTDHLTSLSKVIPVISLSWLLALSIIHMLTTLHLYPPPPPPLSSLLYSRFHVQYLLRMSNRHLSHNFYRVFSSLISKNGNSILRSLSPAPWSHPHCLTFLHVHCPQLV